MRSALRTFTSALGVCAACYLLSTASWQQVLLLFMVASFGWSWFAFSAGPAADGAKLSPRAALLKKERLASNKPLPTVPEQTAVANKRSKQTAPRQRPVQPSQPVQRVQRVYRFPIHELTRTSLTPAID